MDNKERVNLANSYITGYAKGFITDKECNDMIDLTMNEITTVREDDIEISCSADQDWEWHNESM